MILGREPVAIAAAIAIAINLAISFGLKLSGDQVALINALVVAVLGLIVRSATTPTAAPVIPANTEITVTTPAGQPNGTAVVGVTPAGEVVTS